MIVHAGRSRINPRLPDDYVAFDQVTTLVSPAQLRYLCRHSCLTGLDGKPCWESRHLDELLQTFHTEGDSRW